jgi:hypothetical protein
MQLALMMFISLMPDIFVCNFVTVVSILVLVLPPPPTSRARVSKGRHVPQLSGNGREYGQKGKYRREKYWDSEIVIDNQQKSGVREQSLKKERLRFCVKES